MILDPRQSYRNDLTRVIVALLHEDRSLYYYQGFHDIVEFLLLFSHFDVHWTYTFMKSLTRAYLRDYMQSNFDEVEKLLQCLFPLLSLRAPELVPILQIAVHTPFTLFSIEQNACGDSSMGNHAVFPLTRNDFEIYTLAFVARLRRSAVRCDFAPSHHADLRVCGCLFESLSAK